MHLAACVGLLGGAHHLALVPLPLGQWRDHCLIGCGSRCSPWPYVSDSEGRGIARSTEPASAFCRRNLPPAALLTFPPQLPGLGLYIEPDIPHMSSTHSRLLTRFYGSCSRALGVGRWRHHCPVMFARPWLATFLLEFNPWGHMGSRHWPDPDRELAPYDAKASIDPRVNM